MTNEHDISSQCDMSASHAMSARHEMSDSINNVARGFMGSALLFAANEANVFAHLETPQTAEALAGTCNWSSRTARMLLDALVSQGFLERVEGGYRNTPISSTCLVPGRPGYQGNILRHLHNCVENWQHLGESLRTGMAAPTHEQSRSQSELRAFILGMDDIGRMSAAELANVVDLSSFRKLLDLGGGPASYAITFLQKHPAMEAVLFDRPDVVTIAQEQVAAAGLESRFSYLAGDMVVDPIGAGYDLILVSNIIHSYSETTNRALVRKCSDALVPGGTLILKDFLVDDDRSGPPYALMFALHMLVGTGEGDTYTFDQVAAWTRDAGLIKGHAIDLTPQSRLWLSQKP